MSTTTERPIAEPLQERSTTIQDQISTIKMIEEAEELAIAGWAIFPCHNKRPLTKNGFKDATRDVFQVRKWWRQWPTAMIGMAIPRSMMIIDIDPRNGGSLDELISLCGDLPMTLTVISGRGDGGQHLYYTRPSGELTRSRLPKGIDLKTVGGYVIMPPSIHPDSGLPYRWEDPETKIAFPPAAARELLTPKPILKHGFHPGRGPLDHLIEGAGLLRAVAEAEEGDRNRILYWAACRAAEDDLDLEDELIRAARTAGLYTIEARRTVRSAYRAVRRS
jgi:hypothetical protein